MSGITITRKIALWYTAFLVGIAVITFTVFFYAHSAHERNNIEVTLIETVADASEEIEADGENFVVNHKIVFQQNKVYLSVYEADGTMIEGKRPIAIGEMPGFRDKDMRPLYDRNGEKWYLYDSEFRIGDKTAWIRGITKDNFTGGESTFMLRLMLIILPLLIVAAGVGGGLIARSSFKPVRQMIRTADGISRDANVSRRLEMGKSRDELYELADTFNRMLDKIEGVMQRQKQFTSDVSHELRTPITVIKTESQYAADSPERVGEALKEIGQEADKMSGIINNLLLLSRHDEDRMNLEHAEVDLSELCRGIGEQQQSMAEESGIQIRMDIQDGVHIKGDEIMLMRAIMNLVENARKYGCDGGGIIDFALAEENGNAVCTVRDYGTGIASEHIEKVWDRFYQVDGARKDDNSSGLGLSLVKAIAEEHGGTAQVRSHEGKGAEFRLIIPQEGKANEKQDN